MPLCPTEVRPARLAHAGSLLARGFAFAAPLLDEAEMRARVLRLWCPGVRVFRVQRHLIVELPAARRVLAARCTGIPLVERAGALLAAPLDTEEQRRVAAPAGAVVLVEAGRAAIATLLEEDVERPGEWIDLDAYEVIELSSLAAPSPRVKDTLAPVTPVDRGRLGVGEAAAESHAITRELRGLKRTARGSGHARRAGRAASALAWLASSLRSLLGRATSSPPGAVALARRRSRSALERLRGVLGAWLARVALAGWLRALLGRRQARYLGQLVDMFEQRDFDLALRHAIPLGGGDATPKAPALGVPAPRTELVIHPASSDPSTSIHLADELFAHLRRVYRQAFDELSRAGRVKEAAFLLAELLCEHAEAVSFLERHGELILAAEMAECRGLDPAMVVRQWMLARDFGRAVTLARRSGAFAEAVTRLERSPEYQDAARALRLLWADHLAEQGQWVGAMEVVAKADGSDRLAERFAELALAAGGEQAARTLAYQACAAAAPDQLTPRVLALLEADEAAMQRLAFAEALTRGPRSGLCRALARETVRALYADAMREGSPAAVAAAKALADLSGDGPLRADLPAVPRRCDPPLEALTTPRQHRIGAGHCGTLPIRDAAALADGRVLLALGEAGVRVLGRRGNCQLELDAPAAALVRSDTGHRAITLARRGDAYRLTRVDLQARRATAWCEALLSCYARSFDGTSWVVGRGDELFVIDALGDGFDALFRVPDLTGSGALCSIARSGTALGLLTRSEPDYEQWVSRFPNWRVSMRRSFTAADVCCPTTTASGTVVFAERDLEQVRLVVRCERKVEVRYVSGSTLPSSISANDLWIALVYLLEGEVTVRLYGPTLDPTLRLELVLEGASTASVWFDHALLVTGDDRGRALGIDLQSGSVVFLHTV